jgi:uncharacterized pyridoxamine 5'-phosphate oxidase family protein
MAHKLNEDIVHFFQSWGCVIVSTITKEDSPHSSCKGIVEINHDGKIYLLDLYKGSTYANLMANPNISITAVDEHKFKGYCLIGKARIVDFDELGPQISKAWEAKITTRITQRMLKNISGDKGHPRHPEALLPAPEYIIAMETEQVVNLSPHHLKQEG